MKKIILPLLFILLTAIVSCKEDFKVAAPYKDITVVYGILNMNDTAHYIRIEKAFLDETKSAIDMAQVVDSSFYSSLDVKIKEFDELGTTLKSTIILTKVDLNDEGLIKNSGSFFNTKSYAFKFKSLLSAYSSYRLIIKNNNTGRVDSSAFFSVVNGDSTGPNASNFYISSFANATKPYTLNFAKTISESNKLTLNGNIPKNAIMLEGHIIFRYNDSNVITGEVLPHQLDFPYSTHIGVSPGTFTLAVPNSSIFNFLKDEMGSAPANMLRQMDSCDVYVYAASRELYTYQQVTVGQANGLTGDQIKPNYTNMLGTDVLGLLASRTKRTYRNAAIDDATLKSIIDTSFLKDLKIVGRSTR